MKIITLLALGAFGASLAACIPKPTSAKSTEPANPASEANFQVDAAHEGSPLQKGVLGVNGPDKYTDWVNNPTVAQRLKEGGFTIVRLGLVQDGLYNDRDVYPKPGEWRFTEMDAMLKTVFDAGAEPLLTVTGFPAGVPHQRDKDNYIVSADWEEYARFVAGFVKHINIDQALGEGRKVRYWQLWNEPDGEPEGKFRSREDYARYVRIVAPAIKKADPSVKIIGPVHAWSDLAPGGWVSFAAQELGQHIDLLCWHDYGGQPDQSDADRMVWPREHYGTNVTEVLTGGKEKQFVGPGNKKFGVAITEYNMAWMEGPKEYEDKFRSSFNAAYIAASIVNAANADMEVFCFYVFTQAGKNMLGLVDNVHYRPYKPFHVFPLFSKHVGSTRLPVKGTAPGLEILATRHTDGSLRLFVVNTAPQAQTVTIDLEGLSLTNPSATVYTLDETRNGDRPAPLALQEGSLTTALPPLSVSAVIVKTN